MKSIMFFIESLDGGGAEQILETLMLKIPQNKFRCTLYSAEEYPQSKVKHKFFFVRNPANIFQKIIKMLKVKFSLVAPETIVSRFFFREKYDVEVAFCEGYATKLIGNSKKRRGTKKAAWVHTDVINNPWSEEIFGSADEERRCYENFDAIVCVSETIRDSFVKKYGLADRVHVLYNLIDDKKIKENSKGNPDGRLSEKPFNFIMAGRLVKVKGYERLINIAAKLKNEGYNFSVTILGRGVLLNSLRDLTEKLGLNDRIFFLEYQTNPHSFIAKSDALICSSYAEGYSTTVTEAIILGKPVITTECSGMREIFGDKECGIICENSDDALFEAIKSVLDNPEKLKEYTRNSAERAKDFSIEKRIAELEDYLEKI